MKDQLHQWHRSVVRGPWQCTVSVTLRKWYNLTLKFSVWHWCAFPLIYHIINFHFKVSWRHTENLLLKIICEPWNHEIRTAGGCNILCSGGVWGFWKTNAFICSHLQGIDFKESPALTSSGVKPNPGPCNWCPSISHIYYRIILILMATLVLLHSKNSWAKIKPIQSRGLFYYQLLSVN